MRQLIAALIIALLTPSAFSFSDPLTRMELNTTISRINSAPDYATRLVHLKEFQAYLFGRLNTIDLNSISNEEFASLNEFAGYVDSINMQIISPSVCKKRKDYIVILSQFGTIAAATNSDVVDSLSVLNAVCSDFSL